MTDNVRKRVLSEGATAIVVASIVIVMGCKSDATPQNAASRVVAEQTWKSYRHLFITSEGRVMRPRDADTVSEGQAYAMLRAAWMGDKKTFDLCYRWTERNLVRSGKTGDSLLAWRWKDGMVVDWMPASDSDIDYGLSLLLAERRWPGSVPQGLEPYGTRADKLLNDILNLETIKGPDGRLYLLPWLLHNRQSPNVILPQNPSYYSPAHFRIFYERTGDARWLELVDTTYDLLTRLSREFAGRRGTGLVPDWCAVDHTGRLVELPGKNNGFGWDAVRIPFRIGLDWYWFRAPEARLFLTKSFALFLERQWQTLGAVYSEYAYDGTCQNPYENPAFYAAYAVALHVAESLYAPAMLKKNRIWLKNGNSGWYYADENDYYVNSLAWIADAVLAGIIVK